VIDMNKTDANHVYPAMTRPQVIETFMDKVIKHLRTQPNPLNIGYLFYYSYDSAGKSDMCDATAFNTSRGIKGTCFNGVIDPITGDLLPDVVAALMHQPQLQASANNSEAVPAAIAIPEHSRNTAEKLAIRKSFLVCCEQVRWISNN
jgi:hypothetical protein